MAFLLSVATAALLLRTAFAQTCATIQPAHAPTMASGYVSSVVMNGLKSPRGLAWDSAGALLIVEAGGGGIRYVKLTDNGGNSVCVASSKTLINDSALNHGIQFSADGKTLYVSKLAGVDSYPYDASTGAVGTKTTLIINMSNADHNTRTLLIPKSAPNSLLVSRGSNANIDPDTENQSSGRSMIKIFDLTKTAANTDYTANGVILGWGLRNSVGVGENPNTGEIWSVENGCDDMTRLGTDVHLNNPGEELNYHGRLNDTSSKEFGANYGYPDCFPAWDPSSLPSNSGIQVGTQFLIGSPSGSLSDSMCATTRHAPRLTFPAHNAPIDIKFKADSSAAYVSFHGSWDRNPPDGYRLSRINFGADGQPVQPANSTTALTHIMYNPNNSACPNSCFRPAGLLFDSKGRLLMTSDATGELFIITGV